MQLRFVAAAFLLLGTPLAAQAQDPDKPQNSPQAQLEELQRERERLQKEIGYARERAAKKQQLLKDKLSRSQPTYRAIDAGASVPPAPVMPAVQPPRQARVGTAEEFANQPEGTAMVVNGRPVPQRAIDELVAYLGSVPGAGDAAMQMQRALFEVEVTRNSMFGPLLERAAFGGTAGKRTGPIRTGDGIAVLVLRELVKGERPELDRAVGTAIQVPYTQDPTALGKAQMAVNTGQIDLIVRDDALRQQLPAMFLPQAAPAVSQTVIDTTAVEKQMAELSAIIAQLQGKDDDDSKRKLREVERMYAELKASLSRGAATVEKPIDADEVIKEAPAVPPVKKKQ
jgi:flagellar motility protein MotE (MotC chaperone)